MLTRHGVGGHRRVESYHDHNKRTSGQKAVEKLRHGAAIALVSDAGTPAVSDPCGAEAGRGMDNKQ